MMRITYLHLLAILISRLLLLRQQHAPNIWDNFEITVQLIHCHEYVTFTPGKLKK